MAYALSNTISAFKGTPSINNKMKLGIDLTLIALLAIAGGSLFGLRINQRVSLGVIGFAGTLALSDMVALIARKVHKGYFFTTKKEHLRSIILANQQITPDLEAIEKPYHPIIGNLFLGNKEGFLETTSTIRYKSSTSPGEVYGSNPGSFRAVITACPLEAIGQGITQKQVEIDFSQAEHPITWYYLGRMWGDAPEYWDAFIHDVTWDATWHREELANRSLAPDDTQGWDDTLREKTEAITGENGKYHSVSQWFEPLFQVLDRAVFEGTNTLVHCHAGISRSATLMAAYLIERFKVTPQEAVNYLKNRRACVSPKFMDQLNEYATHLSQDRLARQIISTLYDDRLTPSTPAQPVTTREQRVPLRSPPTFVSRQRSIFQRDPPGINFFVNTSAMPLPIFNHTMNFLNDLDLHSLTLVCTQASKWTKSIIQNRVIMLGTSSFVSNESFSESIIRLSRFWNGTHSVYLKLNDEKSEVSHFFIDKSYPSRDALTDTYLFNVTIEAVDQESSHRIQFKNLTVFHVEAREFRGNNLATWGEDVDEHEARKLRELFYSTFRHNRVHSL